MWEHIGGVVPPAVTPLTAEGALDRAGLERLLEHFIRAGCHGVFMMGTTGEAYVLPEAVRAEAVAHAGAVLDGRLPLYVGVGDSTPERVRRNGEQAAAAGAEVLVLISPPSLSYSESERAAYFLDLAAKLPRPVLLYNIPPVNGNPVTPAMLERLIGAPNIIGLKDSESNAVKSAQVLALLQSRPEAFRWFEGNDNLSAQSLLMGAHGIVNGGANVFPALYVALYEAAQQGDPAAVRAVQARLIRAQRLFEVDVGRSTWFGSFVKTTKYALQVLGICQEHCSFPFQPLGSEARREVERMLADLAEAAPPQ